MAFLQSMSDCQSIALLFTMESMTILCWASWLQILWCAKVKTLSCRWRGKLGNQNRLLWHFPTQRIALNTVIRCVSCKVFFRVFCDFLACFGSMPLGRYIESCITQLDKKDCCNEIQSIFLRPPPHSFVSIDHYCHVNGVCIPFNLLNPNKVYEFSWFPDVGICGMCTLGLLPIRMQPWPRQVQQSLLILHPKNQHPWGLQMETCQQVGRIPIKWFPLKFRAMYLQMSKLNSSLWIAQIESTYSHHPIIEWINGQICGRVHTEPLKFTTPDLQASNLSGSPWTT